LIFLSRYFEETLIRTKAWVKRASVTEMSEEDDELEEEYDDDFDEGWEEDFDDENE
jgi:hypothetical protein